MSNSEKKIQESNFWKTTQRSTDEVKEWPKWKSESFSSSKQQAASTSSTAPKKRSYK